MSLCVFPSTPGSSKSGEDEPSARIGCASCVQALREINKNRKTLHICFCPLCQAARRVCAQIPCLAACRRSRRPLFRIPQPPLKFIALNDFSSPTLRCFGHSAARGSVPFCGGSDGREV